MEIIHIFDQRPGHSNQGNILLESLVNEIECVSSEYSIDNLDKLKPSSDRLILIGVGHRAHKALLQQKKLLSNSHNTTLIAVLRPTFNAKKWDKDDWLVYPWEAENSEPIQDYKVKTNSNLS